ncbi:MAG TPA: cell envelope integrity protein TolA [Moraxellaceae bacterium]|nr:cell envelope integrity protein TolA [Moraxellaceae bacterium]
MLHADARPAPVLETRRALNRSLLLHVGVLGLVVALPYLHQPPKVVEPPAIQAVLVPKAVVQQPAPTPVEAPPPPPVPEQIEVPEPVTEPPKIALPKVKPEEKPTPRVAEKKPEPVKPLLKKPLLNTAAMDEEMKSLQREMQQAEMDRMRREMESTATAMKVSANAALIDRYRGMIAQRVESKWNRPLSARAGMTATLRISILPGGEVANVVVATSSGDAAFDASAIEAVKRANPLPVPDDPTVFSQSFRNFTLKFRPEDL